MFKVILLTLCAVAVLADTNKDDGRIYGGSVTTIDNYPTIAAVLSSSNLVTYSQSCGGTILNQRSVLSAAHCFDHTLQASVALWRFRVGSSFASSGGIVHNVHQIIMHEGFVNTYNLSYDIAIIRSATTIAYTNVVQPASIAGTNYNLADNQVVWAAGWGFTEFGWPSEQLRHVQVWTINQEICRQRYGSLLTDNMLCSGWLDVGIRDQCGQDSGGPLYHNSVVVGVCSWGFGCADSFYPGVNVRVSRFTPWIQANA